MDLFEIKCTHLRNTNKKFFNDEKPKEYFEFLVENPEIIPDRYVCFIEKRDKPCIIFILSDLIKEEKINFGNLYSSANEYKFIISFQEAKSAKFNTNNRNWMVLKTKDYLENTIEKIGFWDSDDYLYESAKKAKGHEKKKTIIESESKINWRKTFPFCLSIIIFFFLVFLILKLAVKNI